jgi:SAM-dependent methyltransferase
MSGFSADWLHLREPFDHAARHAAAGTLGLPLLGAALRAGQTAEAPLSIIDLACGTGANLRETAPRLGGRQHWLLIDHDPTLLAALPGALAQWARDKAYRFHHRHDTMGIEGPDFTAEVASRHIDLARSLDTVPFSQAQLITASALLDLASASWLDALLGHSHRAHAAMLFALNVDGRTLWQQPDTGDEPVHSLFSQHQRRDKGFGPALGPGAIDHMVQGLASAGCRVQQSPSDWLVDGRDPAALALQQAMIEGMAEAAMAQSPAARADVLAWKARRMALAAQTCLRVGHVDILALASAGQ